ncbi:MAG: ABC transporter ATP-binding protein [Candidatus Omnitrophica bacterium]|nr:ABC transporter ATP-binding protein [Candidatus Omnitrophota bacterium]
MIQIEHLTKKFGSTTAVDNLTLRIKKGELFSFLGPNGAGKTTTIKTVTGLLKPTSGRVLVGGYDIQKEPLMAKRLIGYIPDVPFLYEKLTGLEFLKMIAGLYELDGKDFLRDADELLETFSLEKNKNQLIEDYSHGMRQKLVMAACLLHKPDVIIVDEPFVALDPKSARIVKDVFKQKAKEGVTVFMSTHTLSVAEELSDRVGIINTGKLIALGSVRDIKGQSACLEDIFLKLTEEG